MQIDIKTKRLDLAHQWTISRNSSSFKENVFITLERDNISGLGEAAPNIRYGESAEKTIQAIQSAISILGNSDFMDYQVIKVQLELGIKDQNCARAAIDMAILDWVSKSKNLPLYKFFGLNPEDIPHTSYSIGIDSPLNMQNKVQEYAHMPVFKIKLGTKNDREIITAIREVTSRPIRVDINEAWLDKEKAIQEINWLAEHGVEFVEQPMPADMLNEHSWLKQRSPIPLIADESVIHNEDIPLLKNAFDGINIKLMKAGGTMEALEMIKTARKLDMKVMLGCMIESSLAISAAAHIAPLADFIDLDGSLLLANDPYEGLRFENGHIILNDSPGLGVWEKHS